MATNYPANLDAFPTVIDNIDDIMASHINNTGDAIEALETKIGVNSSAVTSSLDYLLKNITGGHNHNGSNSALLSIFKTGDLLLSSVTTLRLNWTNLSSTYSNSFIRINASPSTTATGSNSHTHSAGTYSISAHTHGVGSYAGPNHTHTGTTAVSSSSHRANSGGGQAARQTHTHTYTTGGGGTAALTGTSASDGGGAITGTSGSGDHIPAYVTAVVFQRN